MATVPRPRPNGAGLAALLLFALSSACTSAPIEYRDRLTLAGGTPIDLQVLTVYGDARAARTLAAAREGMTALVEWFGPFRGDRVRIVDDGPADAAADPPPAGTVRLGTPWLEGRRSSALAHDALLAAARAYWRSHFADGPPSPVEAALVAYASDRLVARHDAPTYAEPRFFGEMVPVTVRPVRGDARLARGAAAGDSEARRGSLALHTLERHVGWPVLQQALELLVAGEAPTDVAGLGRALETITGDDFSWFLATAFTPSRRYDYAVTAISSAPADDGLWASSVTVARLGDATFTGTSRPPVGPYESGRALTIRVAFEDGQHVEDTWDGRAESKTLQYLGAAPVTAAHVDPERVLLLDADWRNNSRSVTAERSQTATRWAAAWMVWLQDRLMTYSGLF